MEGGPPKSFTNKKRKSRALAWIKLLVNLKSIRIHVLNVGKTITQQERKMIEFDVWNVYMRTVQFMQTNVLMVAGKL
jgi:hypothetical protein